MAASSANRGSALSARECLEALGIRTAEREVVPVTLPDQEDAAFMWRGGAIHPLQPLENAFQRAVRRAVKNHAPEQAREVEVEELSKYFTFGGTPPSLLNSRSEEASDEEFLAAVKMNHLIEKFYLFRLLVNYRIESKGEITDDRRAAVSGTLTSLLHNDKKYMSWVSAWLTEKISQLGDEIQAQNASAGGDRVLFFLKGGRALKYFLGTPEEGENDWDTQVLINPNLPPEEWYATFNEVHDRMLRKLTDFKAEFTSLVGAHAREFTEYIVSLEKAVPAAVEDDEDDEYDAAARAFERYDIQSANCKAELIDIGIPRRDTPAAIEEWTHLNGRLLGQRLKYPGHHYYLSEYLAMVREAFEEGADVRKAPKRIGRLTEILNVSSLDQVIDKERTRVRRLLPQIHTAAAARGLVSERLFTVQMYQFADAYNLEENAGLREVFDAKFSKDIQNIPSLIKYRPELAAAIAGYAKWKPEYDVVTKDVGLGQRISATMSQHLQDRAAFIRRNLKDLTSFVRELWQGVFRYDEELEVQFAITGAYASYLHGTYQHFDRMTDLEPVQILDIALFALPEAKPEIVLELVQPRAAELASRAGSRLRINPGDRSSLLVSWSDTETIGEFRYQPLVARIRVEQGRTLPQLSFIQGLPVLDLRHLSTEYRKRTATTEEPGYRGMLNSASMGVAEIMSWYDF